MRVLNVLNSAPRRHAGLDRKPATAHRWVDTTKLPERNFKKYCMPSARMPQSLATCRTPVTYSVAVTDRTYSREFRCLLYCIGIFSSRNGIRSWRYGMRRASPRDTYVRVPLEPQCVLGSVGTHDKDLSTAFLVRLGAHDEQTQHTGIDAHLTRCRTRRGSTTPPPAPPCSSTGCGTEALPSPHERHVSQRKKNHRHQRAHGLSFQSAALPNRLMADLHGLISPR